MSSGFPLKAGQVSATNLNQVRVYVAGVEQAVALYALHGKFPDGSYRSIGIQFTYTLTHNVPVAAQVKINQGTRATTDLTWIEPTKATHVSKRAVIAPTDPVHLCDTFCTLQPLTPATNDTGVAVDWHAAATSKWAGNTQTGTGGKAGTAIYMHQQGLFAEWCRTGDRTYYQWAYDWAIEMADTTQFPAAINLLTLSAATPDLAGHATCANNNIYNPELLIGNNSCGFGQNEQYSTRWLMMATCYWIIGWRQFKRTLNMMAQQALRHTPISYANQRDFWLSDTWGVRFNLGVKGIACVLAAYLTECTTGFAMSGTAAITNWDYATFLPWTLNAYQDYIWNRGDYRDGLVGLRPAIADLPIGTGEWTGVNAFQLVLVAEYLMIYYDLVAPDPRIPVWLKTIADYQIAQSRAAVPTDPHYSAGQGGVRWVSAYYNLPATVIPAPSFTATTNGTTTMTWTGGPIAADERGKYAQYLSGPNLPDTTTAVMSWSGTALTLNKAATGTGSGTYSITMTAWYVSMFAALQAWVYGYTGDPTYKTWAERGMFPGNLASLGVLETKQWGENWGGTRQSIFYYYAGGQVRATPGVHPTAIVNPPIHPNLNVD